MSEQKNVLDNPIPELRAAVRKLRGVCKQVSEHVDELVDAWLSGALIERDGKGGTRSNRNWELSAKLRAALEETKEFDG